MDSDLNSNAAIHWESPESVALWNPRISEVEREAENALLAPWLAAFAAHVWIRTSGSSGAPKWVALSKVAILESAVAVNRHLEADPKDIWLHALPDFHVGGLGIWARSYLSGSQVVAMSEDGWSPGIFCGLASKKGATLSALVPTQIYDLVQLGLVAPPSIRAVVVGGAALAEDLYFAARKLGWPLLPSYGATECASQVATADLSTLGGNSEFPKLTLLSHIDVKEVEGCLAFFGRSLLTGYAYREGDRFLFVDPKVEGWFVSEDRGTFANGELSILGRASDFVKVAGEQTNIGRLRSVWDAGRTQGDFASTVVAVADERLGHCVALAVGQREVGTELRERVREFNAAVLPYERIRRVFLGVDVARSELGKVRSEALRVALETVESVAIS